MPLYLPVLLGTARRGRRSEHVARFVLQRLEQRDDARTRLLDPRELPFGDLQAREWEMDPRPPAVAAFVEDMAASDGFVVVTPEYNHGVPGALKNVLDHLHDEWNRKPFGLVGCGGMSGGARVVAGMRQIVAGLGAVSVPRSLHVPHVGKAFGPEGPLEDEEKWAERVDGFLDEVAWYARALRRERLGEEVAEGDEAEVAAAAR
jgi:NAD(P)H-dependent FMN reductase